MLDKQRKYMENNREFLRVVGILNSAFLVSSLGDRLWAFSMGIIMHRLGGMTWIAIHQMTDAIFQLVFATKVGDLLDRMNRSRGLQSVLAVNNICITLSAMSFYLIFAGFGAEGLSSKLLLVTAIVFGSISRVASEAQKTAFTKDWILVLIEKSKGARLSTQNGIMNMIDQSAAFVVPFIAGTMLDVFSGSFCCIVIMIWNIVSWILEAGVLLWIYSVTPELALRPERTLSEKTSSPFAKYFRQKAFRAMFGLALLFMTVLGFDNLALSYGASQGMSASQLGFFRSLGSLLGFAGNGCYAIVERYIGVLVTALIGLTLQNVFINFCSTAVFLPGNSFNTTGYLNDVSVQSWWNTLQTNIFGMNSTEATPTMMSFVPFDQLSPSIIVFFVGITSARFGLWIADPAITQIMQETIPESERYSVNAAQRVFCELFSVLKDVMVIAFPTTETFGTLIIISCGFVFIGYLFYISYFISNFSCASVSHSADPLEMSTPEREKLVNQNLVEQALASA